MGGAKRDHRIKRLNTAVNKPMSNIYDEKFVAIAKPPLREVISTAQRVVEVPERASSYRGNNRILKSSYDERPHTNQIRLRTRYVHCVFLGRALGSAYPVPGRMIKRNLYRSHIFASIRVWLQLQLWQKIQVLAHDGHQIMRHPYFALQSKRGQLLIIEMDHSVASPGHLANSYNVPRTKQARRRKVAAEVSATIPLSPETEITTSTEPDVPRIAKIVRFAHILVLLVNSAATRFRNGSDNCSEAPQSMISHEACTNTVRRRGTKSVRCQLTTSGSRLGNHTQLSLRVVYKELTCFARKPPNFALCMPWRPPRKSATTVSLLKRFEDGFGIILDLFRN